MNRPSDLVAIPPLARTVIYYGLAVALAVVSALVADGRIEPLYLMIVSGVGGVFFGVAGSNVAAKVKHGPLDSTNGQWGSVDRPDGYHSGVRKPDDEPTEGADGYASGVGKKD